MNKSACMFMRTIKNRKLSQKIEYLLSKQLMLSTPFTSTYTSFKICSLNLLEVLIKHVNLPDISPMRECDRPQKH